MKVATNVKIDFSESARSVDSNGFMHVEGVPLFRSGIIEIPGIELQAWVPDKLDYTRKYRLRIEQSVLDRDVGTFAHKPVTWGHKWIGGNSKNDFIGFTGDAPYIDGDLACNNMTLADGDAVYRIGIKEREELSAGISGEIERSAVNYADYDLLSFECNHVAVVKKGKAGHRVRILNEMFESGEIEGRFLMEENKQPEEEIKTEEKKAEEPKAETPVSDVPPAEEDKPTETKGETDEKEDQKQKEGEATKEAEPEKVEEKRTEENGEDGKPTEEGANKKATEEVKKAEEEVDKPAPVEEEKVNSDTKAAEEKKDDKQIAAWAYNVTDVVHSDSPKDPSISGQTVSLSFEEGGVYEYKNGKIARIQLEEIIEESVTKKANEMVEAFSICKSVNSGVELTQNVDSMYRSTAKLVFGNSCEGCNVESLKRMLQGYLFGRSANLSGGCEEKKDIRTIEVNL